MTLLPKQGKIGDMMTMLHSLMKFVVLILWMVFVPILAGTLPCALLPKARRTPGTVILAGYFVTFTVFELLALPVLLLSYGGDFRLLTILFSIAGALLAVLGFVLCGGVRGITLVGLTEENEGQRLRVLGFLLWAVFGLLLLFQLYMAYTHLFFDGDDAYYVASSVITYEKGTMYRILPYTGGATRLDVRHALALFPMWISYLSGVSGMHPANITHSVMPLLMIPLADLAAAMAAKQMLRRPLFAGKRSVLFPVFMILISLLQIFGNVSIYTPETFLMMRSWQGKSLFVNLIIPSVFWLFLRLGGIYEETAAAANTADAAGAAAQRPRGASAGGEPAGEKRFVWLLLSLIVVTGGLSSSMAVVMTMGLIWLCGFFLAAAYRKAVIFRNAVLACAPGYLYALLFLALRGAAG